MSQDATPDAVTTGAGPLVLEGALRPAFAVDATGAVAWAGPLARRLLDAGGLEPGSAETLRRIAASGAATMARLRFSALGRAAPLVVQTRQVLLEDDRILLVVEALSEIDPATELPSEEPEIVDGIEPPVGAEAMETSDEVPPAAEEAPGEIVADEPATEDAAEPVEAVADEPSYEPEPAPAPWSAAPDAELEALRFVFEIDAYGHVAVLSPALEAAVGSSARGAVGRPWSELADALDLDPDGAVATALSGTAGWDGLKISWPMDDGRRLPLALSALPMFGGGRAFVGFRGLGRALGAPEATAVAASIPEPEIDEARAPDPVAEEASEPQPLVQTPPPAAQLARNVVALRGGTPPLLTTSEESAFDEIARRLRDIGVRTSATPYDDEDPRDASREPWMINDIEARVTEGARPDELLRVLDRLPVGALALKGGQVVYANRATLELLGHPDLASLAERDAGTLFAEPLPGAGDAGPSTLRLLARDGLEVEAEVRLSSIFWEGEPATLVSLKRAEGAVAAAREAIEREKETAAILDTATDGVLTLDGAGRILSVNRSAEALFGFEAREVVGTLFTLSLAPESRKVAFDYLDRLRANGVAAVMNDGREVLGLVRQGGAIPLYMTIGRIGAHENDRFCAVLRDITPWKKAEEELLAAKREAERASRQKSEFLTKVSHEIRTPLNAIIGFAEVMMEERFGPVGSPRYKDYLRDIHVSGGHLVGLVNDLVDIARIESGGVRLDPTSVDLNEIAAQAAALLQPQANRDHVIIRASLARALPPVMADRRSVRQIVTTLTAHAVKLSRAGGQVIVATATTDSGQAVIRVRDAGAGLTKQEIARALEPFRPLGETSEGASLALPLAKALAEANDAVLTLSSEPGQGTLAEVAFPPARVLAS